MAAKKKVPVNKATPQHVNPIPINKGATAMKSDCDCTDHCKLAAVGGKTEGNLPPGQVCKGLPFEAHDAGDTYV